MKKGFFVIFSMLILTGCSSHYFSKGDTGYLQARNGALLEIPPPLTGANINHFYDLPSQNQSARINIALPMKT